MLDTSKVEFVGNAGLAGLPSYHNNTSRVPPHLGSPDLGI